MGGFGPGVVRRRQIVVPVRLTAALRVGGAVGVYRELMVTIGWSYVTRPRE